jgi:hypothetical protein
MGTYEHLATDDLLREVEGQRFLLAELDVDHGGDPAFAATIAVAECQLADLTAEVDRRRRLYRAYRARGGKAITPPPDRRGELLEIKRRLPLRAFLERQALVTFRKAGHRWVCSCPFPDHDDPDPSFTVDDEKGLWHCFGCGRGGDVFSFAQDYLGVEFAKAADDLRELAGLPRPAAAARGMSSGAFEYRAGRLVERA